MSNHEYTAIDPYVCDRAIFHHLAAFKHIQHINSFRVVLILLGKCTWSITYFGNSKRPVARITNNGQLVLTSSEAFERYEIHPSAFYVAIRDLCERGLIAVVKRGKSGNQYAILPFLVSTLYRRYAENDGFGPGRVRLFEEYLEGQHDDES